jgi:hypothetical protein
MKALYATLVSATVAAGLASLLIQPGLIMVAILLALLSRMAQSALQQDELILLRVEVESLRKEIGRFITRQDI